ncbi:Sensory box histidine kinase [Chitinispirillum alkaliphilum]|nr:Sensory box histidine kinase [Chitinispirillum alkaliphilum]
MLERPVLTRTLLSAVRSSLRSRSSQYRVAQELGLRRKAEESLTAANEELQAFSYSVAHDLRAPLRTMRSFSMILLEDYSNTLDHDGKDYLERIIKGANQLGKLIDDMLNLSKVASHEMTIGDVDLSKLSSAIRNELQQAAPERQVEFKIEDNMKTRGDERLLKIALTNLLGNAWKYTSNETHAIIEFGSFERNSETVYFVRDTGAGFSMGLAEKLFKPFQRLHSEREFPGTGIGLTIVQRVIRRHNGQIWAESEENRGSTFYFTLKL